jgi:putative membrane protein
MTERFSDPEHPGPRSFAIDDPSLAPVAESDLEVTVAPPLAATAPPRGARWAARLFWSGLVAGAGLLLTHGATAGLAWLLSRDDWLAWGLTAALGLGVSGLLLWSLGEIIAMRRLSVAADLRVAGERAAVAGIGAVQAHIQAVRAALRTRTDLDPAFARLHAYADEAADGRALLAALDREIGARLDRDCVAAILATARRTGVVTAISPFAILDVAATLALNLRLLRRISVLTGGRTGALATWRLVRTVLATLLVAGGVGAVDGMLGDFLGGSLVRTVSRKAGEGVLNSLLTVRLGLVALRLLRPITPVEVEPPSVASLAARLVDMRTGAPLQPE